MTNKEIIKKLLSKKILTITSSEQQELIANSEIILKKDTMMRGLIYILSYDNHVIIQEQTDKKELIARLSDSLDKAKKIVEERIETYNRMWDGCGCKINYFDPN